MKKIIFILIFLFNIMPSFRHGHLVLGCPNETLAQESPGGGENGENGENNETPPPVEVYTGYSPPLEDVVVTAFKNYVGMLGYSDLTSLTLSEQNNLFNDFVQNTGSDGGCPCLTNLTSIPKGGLLRNENGKLIVQLGQTSQIQYLGYTLTVETDYVFASDGSPIEVNSIVFGTNANGISIDPATLANLTFNCLGYALTGGGEEFYIDAGRTADINALIGINSIQSAINNGTFSNNFSTIQPGDALILLNSDGTGYVHGAIYNGSGYYLTKDGRGDGNTSVQYQSLQTLQTIYPNTIPYFIKKSTITLPNTSSSLGDNTDGLVTPDQMNEAKSDGCGCN